jgi:3'-5' exoribonuclease
MKTIFIRDIKAGDFVDEVFVLAEKNLSRKKDGTAYLSLTAADKTGILKGVMWDNLGRFGEEACSGDFVRITGNVSEYRGTLQLVVKSASIIKPEEVDPTDFLPATERDVEGMFNRLVQLVETLRTPHLKSLLLSFFRDTDFVKRFKIAPAAKQMHHAYLGGLLEHTLSMALLVEKIAGHYGGIDRDMLLTGAVLHDIGKIREFEYDVKIDYSDEGRFLSHIVIGALMVREKIQALPDFPKEAQDLILHMVVSHHGSREFGSPEPPKTIEAVMLNYIDEIDAKVNGIREFVESEGSGENWTSYHRILARHFYTGTLNGKQTSPCSSR